MSESIHTKRTDCRLCESEDLVSVIELRPSALADSYLRNKEKAKQLESYPLNLYLCRNCGHTQLLDVIDPEVIYRNYIYSTTSSLGLVDHFCDYAEHVIEFAGIEDGALVVDIGSNDGSLLRAFKGKNMRVLGIDPAVDIAKQASDGGIETIPEFFDKERAVKIRKKYGVAKIITINNLLANIDCMREIFDSIVSLLDEDGIFVVEFAYVGDLIKNMVFDYIYHEHLSYFSIQPLTEFAGTFGLQLLEARPQSTKGGSMRLIFQRSGGEREKADDLEEIIGNETKLCLRNENVFQSFCGRIDSCREELLAFLKAETAEGKSIAGYGASATSTTLIHHFGLGEYIEFLVDDFEAKQGCYSPGSGIPVLAPSELYSRSPDIVLILAWRYAEPIMQKHNAYSQKGGRFIVPIPKLQVSM